MPVVGESTRYTDADTITELTRQNEQLRGKQRDFNKKQESYAHDQIVTPKQASLVVTNTKCESHEGEIASLSKRVTMLLKENSSLKSSVNDSNVHRIVEQENEVSYSNKEIRKLQKEKVILENEQRVARDGQKDMPNDMKRIRDQEEAHKGMVDKYREQLKQYLQRHDQDQRTMRQQQVRIGELEDLVGSNTSNQNMKKKQQQQQQQQQQQGSVVAVLPPITSPEKRKPSPTKKMVKKDDTSSSQNKNNNNNNNTPIKQTSSKNNTTATPMKTTSTDSSTKPDASSSPEEDTQNTTTAATDSKEETAQNDDVDVSLDENNNHNSTTSDNTNNTEENIQDTNNINASNDQFFEEEREVVDLPPSTVQTEEELLDPNNESNTNIQTTDPLDSTQDELDAYELTDI